MPRASIFVTCIVDQLFPKVGMAMVEVLERIGWQVEFPDDQTCCGQPAFNTGYRDEAREVARHFLRDLVQEIARTRPKLSWYSRVTQSANLGMACSRGKASRRAGCSAATCEARTCVSSSRAGTAYNKFSRRGLHRGPTHLWGDIWA